MRIDKEKLMALVSLPDTELWETVRQIGASHGFKLPTNPPPHEEMDKMRRAISDGKKPNLNEAIRLINDYRKGHKNG